MQSIIEELKEKQRQNHAQKKAETEAMKKQLGFSFSGLRTGYRTQSWTPGVRARG